VLAAVSSLLSGSEFSLRETEPQLKRLSILLLAGPVQLPSITLTHLLTHTLQSTEFRYKSERDRAWDVAAKEGIQRVERGTPRNLQGSTSTEASRVEEGERRQKTKVELFSESLNHSPPFRSSAAAAAVAFVLR